MYRTASSSSGVDRQFAGSVGTSWYSMRTKSKGLPIDKGFEYYLSLNLKTLWLMGISINLKNNDKATRSNLKGFPTYTTNFLGVTDGFFQILWIMDAWSYDKHLVTAISSNFLSNITAICKGFRLATSVEHLQSLLHEMAMMWKRYHPTDECIREKILLGAEKTRFFCKCYTGIVIGVLVSWGVPPVQDIAFQYLRRNTANHTYDFSQRIFMVRYPFPITTITTYLSVLFEEQWVLFGSAIGWLCCDALFAQLTSHVCLQLQILQYDIESLVSRENNDSRLKEKLVVFVKRHTDLLRMCDSIEDIFSPVIFTTTTISSLNLCVNVFELREMIASKQFAEAAIHIFLIISIFLQIVVYCTFAESLTEQTSLIADAVYNSKWTEKNYKFRMYLQMFILKAQRPFYCTAYGFFPISHVQLTKIVKGAMSYYMYLETTS